MTATNTYPPGLEERFQQPPGWQWHSLKNPKGCTLRFGIVTPQGRAPEAIVVGLQGLSEFAEKYFEVARTLLEHNLAFCMMDWQGQGKSDRHLENPHKRHSNSFDEDLEDLHFFITECITKYISQSSNAKNAPLAMLAHSMGSNIGLRYLIKHPDHFACAAFSSPLVEIKALMHMPALVRQGLTTLLGAVAGETYVPGGCDWHPEIRGEKGRALLSSDPVRNLVQDMWCQFDPMLQVGSITFGWLAEAEASCRALQKASYQNQVTTPCLLGLAGNEHLVNNKAARALAKRLKNARILELDNTQHEILMERDGPRSAFINAFLDMLKQNNSRKS